MMGYEGVPREHQARCHPKQISFREEKHSASILLNLRTDFRTTCSVGSLRILIET